ncbi:hypothetical protein BpHYR1_023848 [Brachionus plicatilis]|uniref:Uncharacterized protein n=1 Tax=Brachionus plicatilis TaxID=10195 RepID=A0A3M7S4R4_BRAPC|nr:hypothetical protein BpHYR1_023848 [Brachionus plicatilis]
MELDSNVASKLSLQHRVLISESLSEDVASLSFLFAIVASSLSLSTLISLSSSSNSPSSPRSDLINEPNNDFPSGSIPSSKSSLPVSLTKRTKASSFISPLIDPNILLRFLVCKI